jgi:hypothetical protein
MAASKDPFDKVLKILGLDQDIKDMDPIPPEVISISESHGNPYEVPCRVRVRDDEGNLLTIVDISDSQLQHGEVRLHWILNCIKLIHPTPDTATHIRPLAFILDLDGKVHAEPVHTQAVYQSYRTSNYPAHCRIPPSTISDLPLQERLWRAEKFALGMLLYEIMTGHKPFEADYTVQARYRAAQFPEDVEVLPPPFTSLLYACWSAEFGHYIALGKFQQYVHDNPARFALEVTSATIGVAALITMPVLGAIGFSTLGPVGGSLAAGWQSSIGAVQAGTLFSFCQSAAMGGAAATRVIGGARSMTTVIAAAASRLPGASSDSSLRETFVRKFRRGPTLRLWAICK